MNIYFKLGVWTVLFLCVTGHVALAQNSPDKKGAFDVIRERMVSTARENKKLTNENKALKAELVTLQLSVEKYQGEIDELSPKYRGEENPVREQSRDAAGYSVNQGGTKEQDPLIREAQEIYLGGRLLDLDEQQKLRELYLYDLQYQKQELELDLESIKVLHEENAGEHRQELDVLQKDIQQDADREKDLSLEIANLEKAALAYPLEIELLKMENKALKQKIRDLKRLKRNF